MHRFAGSRLDVRLRGARRLARTEPSRFGRRVVLTLLVPYVAWLTFGYEYHFVDGVNLLVHEAGHAVFGPLGETLSVLGGTLLQLAIPIVFCVHFFRRDDRFAAAALAVWVAESLMYTGVYLGDAVTRQLTLIGGGMHDWTFLLSSWGLLRHAEALGFVCHVFASGLAIGAAWSAHRWLDFVPSELGVVKAVGAASSRGEAPSQSLGSALGGAWPRLEDEESPQPSRVRPDPSETRREWQAPALGAERDNEAIGERDSERARRRRVLV